MARSRAAPHSRVKAERRVLSPNEAWATAIRERILADCHPWQRDAVLDPSRRVSMLVGRGGAKTTTMRARAALKLTSIRRADLLYLAVTKDHARELQWEPLQEMNEHYGLELRFLKSEMTATCKRTGGRYILDGMETDQDLEPYRGKSRHEAQIDEAASHNKDRLKLALTAILGPRLGDKKGCIVIGGTPGHDLDGEFYDATRPGATRHAPYADRNKESYKPAYWSSHTWSMKQVYELPRAADLYPALVALWEEALIEKAAQGWSDENPMWMREYLGLWSADHTGRVFKYFPTKDGQPWNQWNPFGEVKLEGIQALEGAIAQLHGMGLRDLHFVVPGDMGHTDHFALNVLAFSPTDPLRRIWHVYWFERPGMYARPIAELVAGPESIARILRSEPLEPLGGIMGITGWPDGSVLDADGSTIDELKNVYGLAFKKADREARAKRGAIELVNGDLFDGRIKVLKGSPLEDQLIQLKWREDQFGQVKEDPRQANHSTDTLVYGRKMIANLFEAGVVAQEAKSPASGTRTVREPDEPRDTDPGIGTADGIEDLLTPPTFANLWGNG